MARLFLDSNIIIEGLLSAWTHSRVVLGLYSKRAHQAVIASYVIGEVEAALVRKAGQMASSEAETLLAEYSGLLRLLARRGLLPMKTHRS
jgi:predicted nucleic acid-binding protein